MPAPLIVVTGTGTAVGKTHFATALVLGWGRTAKVCGFKPVETGVPDGGEGEDAAALRSASTFHVKPASLFLRDGVSPHLAARREGRVVQVAPILAELSRLRQEAEGVVVELAGGLFSPLAKGLLNADLAGDMPDARILVVGCDRLGVLHDIISICISCRARHLRLAGLVLGAPPGADASSGTNAAELSDLVEVPVLGTLPRGSPEELAGSDVVLRVLSSVGVP